MTTYRNYVLSSLTALICATSALDAEALPRDIQKIMDQPKFEHSIWGIYVKDLQTGEVLYDLNSNKLFSPASTTKLVSISALLHAYGNNYRFKTPVYAAGEIKNGVLNGDLILVAQGDLTMGGRQPNADTIAFTKMDHIIANNVSGVILTKEDPLNGLNELAKQVFQKGIKEINGDIVIDDSLFETTELRGMTISPIMINENLIDIVINPTEEGQRAKITWRPEVTGYTVDNQVKSVAKNGPLEINVSSDASGKNIVVEGTIPADQRNVVRTSAIHDPEAFARTVFVQALRSQGVKVNLPKDVAHVSQSLSAYKNFEQVALWTSPPLSEYAKLVLKVSHNLGADLVPLLLAAQKGQKTFDEGMRMIGDFAMQTVKLSPDSFVLLDAAGGNENRLTPQAEVQLLSYIQKLPSQQFQHFYDALPILGKDGSLEDFAKTTPAAGKVRAKPGTGMALNAATDTYFLITQALAGYIEGRNGHLWAYMIVVNNAITPTVNDVIAIFEDEGQISNTIYNNTEEVKINNISETIPTLRAPMLRNAQKAMLKLKNDSMNSMIAL